MVSERARELQAAGLWPVNLPRDYEELHRDFGAFIASLVYRYNKVDRDPRDLINYIWERILTADLLTKYIDATCSEPKEDFTSDEAAKFLGVTLEEFQVYLRKPGCRLKVPQGKRMSKNVSWPVEVINDLIDEPYFCKHGTTAVVPRPVVSKLHFMGYLQRAVHNHFSNWCRTRMRRCQERLGDCYFASKSDSGVDVAWEDRLSKAGADDIEHEVELEVILDRIEQIADSFKEDILGLLHKGYSLAEAVNKTEFATSRDRRIVMRALMLL